MPREPSLTRLEHLDRHSVLTFFADEQMTSGRTNIGVMAIGLMAVIGAITRDGHPVILIFTVVAGVILWSNYRRFRRRIRFALAERGAPRQPA